MIVIVIVVVIVVEAVAGPVILAVHVHGNAPVGAIERFGESLVASAPGAIRIALIAS